MPTRRQFVLDERTNRLLEELAADRAGNRSHVVREAIRLYAQFENQVDEIEADPGFQQTMERSAADIGAGRVVAHAKVKRRSRSKGRRPG
jgi:predicted transcriptional regulator